MADIMAISSAKPASAVVSFQNRVFPFSDRETIGVFAQLAQPYVPRTSRSTFHSRL